MAHALRPTRLEDQEFLFRVYASTRTEELGAVPWSHDQKTVFLRQQFEAQDQHYRRYYPGAEFLVIELDGAPVGRLYRQRMAGEHRLMDIALLPQHRGRGLGTLLMREVMETANQEGLPLRIHVEKFNPALRLYERLGFRVLEDRGVHWFMERAPE
jgi:ribosomal protein S18 acetylase RimI-like enzyme